MNNYDSVLAQIQGAGLLVDRLEIGRMKRCKVEGDRERRGWYSLHEIGSAQGERIIVGSFGIWRGNENNAQKIAVERNALSEEQAAALKKRIAYDRKRAEADRQREAERAAEKAGRVLRQYLPGDGESDYLKRKGVKAWGLRWSPSGNGTCAIPVSDASGKVWGLQILRGKDRGNKLEKEYFPRGMVKKGRYHVIGIIRDVALVCEGYATGATLHESTGLPVVIAFDAGNLGPVVEAIKKTNPRARLLICADDDYLTTGNPGCTAAEIAALSAGGAWCKPIFTADRAGKKLTDFNDLAALEGAQAVRAQIEAAVARLPGGPAPILARGAQSLGGGDGAEKALKPGQYPEARSIMSVDELVDRYIWIDSQKSGIVWDSWKRELADFGKVTDQLPARTRRDDVKDHYLWQSRACHIEHIGFDPSEKDPDVRLNSWWGWPMQPKSGECSLIMDHLWWLTGEERNEDVRRAAYDYLIWWMAYPLQRPGAKHTSAIIMHGPQGTGKSIIFQQVLAKIYGRGKLPKFNYSVILDQKALQDNFNATWENKLFVLTEEAVTSSDKWQLKNELKELVTGEQIRIRKVFTDAYYQKNQLNMAFLSNEDQPLPLDNSDRRHFVIYTPAKREQSYYDDLREEIMDGGIEAFYDYLMNVDLTRFKIGQTPPETEAKRRLVDLSKSSELRFMDAWTNGETEWPVQPCKTDHLYAAYVIWCRRNGEKFPRPSNYFWAPIMRPENQWTKARPMLWENMHYDGQRRQASVQIPPQRILEQHAQAKPADKTESQWLTDCCIAFEELLKGQQ